MIAKMPGLGVIIGGEGAITLSQERSTVWPGQDF